MSCNKEEFVTKHSPISIAVSKSLVYNWIQNSKNNTNNFKLSQRSDTVMIDSLVKEIQWDKAVSYYDEIKLQYVIEVPIIQKIDYAYMIPWNGLSYHPTTYEQKNKRSLIIVQDDSLNIHIAICNILGSSEYFQSGKTNESNNYQFKDTSYSGYVVYTDWNDNILEGYEFEHGMPTGWCINVNGTLDTIPKAKVRWKDCKFVFTWSWYEFIQDYTKKDCKCGHFVGRGELLLEIICYNMPRSSRGGGFSGNFGGNGGYPTIPGRGYRGGNGGGENPTNPDTRTWIQVKLEKAYECIGGAGIKGIMAEVALKEKAKNLCGKSYEELLLQAYDNMIEQGKDCSDINAVNDMLKDLEAMIDANFSQAMKTFRSKYGTLNMNEKEFLNFVNTSPCLDFCSNEAELEKCLIKNFAGLTDEEWEDYKEDQICKNSEQNKAKVDKFKEEISKAIEEELKQLALDFPGVPFDTELFKSVMSKVIKKKTGKLIPLVGLGLDAVELKAAYAAGDYVAMGLSIGSILTEIIPCAMLVDLGLDAASIGNTLYKSYKSLSELKGFLGENSAIFEAIFKAIDDLNFTDALEWVKINSGPKQFAITIGDKIEEFLDKIEILLGKKWIPTNSNTKSLILDNNIVLTYYIDSTGEPSIFINVNGKIFKIRLR